VNARNGHKIWEYATSAVIESGIAVANGIVYFGGGNILYAVTSWAWTARTWRGTPSVAGWPWRPACEAARQRSLSPAGFWRNSGEIAYDRAVFKIMELAGARTQRFAPALVRSTAGRAILYGAIVSRPSRMTPQQALGDTTAFLAATDALHVILAEMTNFTGAMPAGVPVMIAWGTRDRLLFLGQARVAKAHLPEALLVPLPGCGHVPMTDDPPLVADVLLRGSGRA
jgi:pimeloyl-ACP methyl ester carboxylesterase